MMVEICVPRKITATMQTTAISARISAYSASVCPSSPATSPSRKVVKATYCPVSQLLSFSISLLAPSHVTYGGSPTNPDTPSQVPRRSLSPSDAGPPPFDIGHELLRHAPQ